jgi:hypothetical protein
MRTEIHFHTEDTDILQGEEKKDYSGEISIKGTNATIRRTCLTQDHNQAGGTSYVINCIIDGEIEEIDKIAEWIYLKIKDKVRKITVGDFRGACEYANFEKEEIIRLLNKWMK